jgi:hypothetical protein
MKLYICPLCDIDFKQKSHYIQHIQRKNPCFTINEKTGVKIPKITIIDEVTNKDITIKSLENNNILSDIIENNLDVNKLDFITSINDNNECEYCKKCFSRKDSLNRHLSNRCKLRDKQTTDEVEQMKTFCKKILEELKECKNEIVTLKGVHTNNTQSQNVNNNNTNSNNNNTISNNNNTTNSNNNNITIVQFGKEDITKMNIPKLMDVFLKSTGGNIIANMLKQFNCNPEYPEFNSIYISDLAREKVKIYDGKKFVNKKFKFIKDFIVNNVNGNINKICTSFLENNAYKKSEDILKKMHINQVSLKLITGSDAEDIVRDEIKEKNKKKQDIPCQNNLVDKITKTTLLNNNKEELERDFTIEESKRVTHLENKREGLIQITYERLKDELYNGKFIKP